MARGPIRNVTAAARDARGTRPSHRVPAWLHCHRFCPQVGGSRTEGVRAHEKARRRLGCRDRGRRLRAGRMRVVVAELVGDDDHGHRPGVRAGHGDLRTAGASGKPHYAITIRSAENTEFDGAMNFVYQDGTTSHVFDFSGTVTGQNAVATPTNVAAPGSATRTVSSVPNSLRIDVGNDSLTFEGCQAYLPLVSSSSACTFNGVR